MSARAWILFVAFSWAALLGGSRVVRATSALVAGGTETPAAQSLSMTMPVAGAAHRVAPTCLPAP